MVEVRFSENALSDMGSIAAYIARDPEFHAAKQVERFFESIEFLRTHPRMGRMAPEVGHPSIRERIVGNYRVMYHLSKEELAEVITVHHSARKFPFARVLPKATKPLARNDPQQVPRDDLAVLRGIAVVAGCGDRSAGDEDVGEHGDRGGGAGSGGEGV